MRNYTLLLFSLSILAGPKPFETDFCTGYPEGTRKYPELWKDCCIKHDLAYWISGTKEMQENADQRLKSCVSSKGATGASRIMYLGVRIGHFSPFKLKGHWGWAWPSRDHKFSKLTNTQKQDILQRIYEVTQPKELIDEFLTETDQLKIP